jgi:fatty-acid desaturase
MSLSFGLRISSPPNQSRKSLSLPTSRPRVRHSTTEAILDHQASASSLTTRQCRKLPLPARVNRVRIVVRYAMTVGLYHLLALLALLPGLFSWMGVGLAILGVYVFGNLGINLYYHRLLAHRGLVVPRWLECILGVIGVCCMQDTPARWVAVHRRHHEHSDQPNDPHSPLVNFFWAHVGWLLVENDDLSRLGIYERYARDIVRDPFQKWLERNHGWIVVAHGMAFLLSASPRRSLPAVPRRSRSNSAPVC